MMRRYLATAVFVLLLGAAGPLSLFAQTVRLGVRGGLSIPNLQGGNTEISRGYKSRRGSAFGVFSDVVFTPHVAVETQVLFVGQGGLKNGIQSIPSGSLSGSGLPIPADLSLYADFKNETILNYLEIPILAKYLVDIGGGFGAYLGGGPNVGILLNAKTRTEGISSLYVDNAGTPLVVGDMPLPPIDFGNEENIRSDVRTFNFGLVGAFGIFRRLGSSEVSLDFRGSYGLTNVQRDSSEGNNRTGCLAITLGYSIPL